MSVTIQQDHLETIIKDDREIIRIRGTRFRVADIVLMHLRNRSSIAWMVENYDNLNHAQIYSALAYYYDNQIAIDTEIDVMQASDESIEQDAMTLDKFKAKVQSRTQQNDKQ